MRCSSGGRSFLAAALDPRFPAAKLSLLTALIKSGRGEEAVSRFRSWIEPERDKLGAWEGFAELCLYVGATEEYEDATSDLLELFGSSDDPVVCDKVGRACAFAPVADDELSVARATIERALEAESRKPSGRGPSLRLTKAMLEYRAGAPEATLSLLDAETSKVLQPLPQLLTALALAATGREADGRAMLGRAVAMNDWRLAPVIRADDWRLQILRREAESKLLPNLDAFRRGTYWPTAADERLALIATSEEGGLHLLSARLFAEAIANDPGLVRNIDWQCRYRAACAAARCGCDPPTAERPIPPDEQARWRAQALKWLREELTAVRDGTTRVARTANLSQWLFDRDLRAVRDPRLLAVLPHDEQLAFRAFWSDVNGLLASRD
jgi:serine/threonine-protein kinase